MKKLRQFINLTFITASFHANPAKTLKMPSRFHKNKHKSMHLRPSIERPSLAGGWVSWVMDLAAQTWVQTPFALGGSRGSPQYCEKNSTWGPGPSDIYWRLRSTANLFASAVSSSFPSYLRLVRSSLFDLLNVNVRLYLFPYSYGTWFCWWKTCGN